MNMRHIRRKVVSGVKQQQKQNRKKQKLIRDVVRFVRSVGIDVTIGVPMTEPSACPRCGAKIQPGFYCIKCGWMPPKEQKCN
jgi:hypothetical protein